MSDDNIETGQVKDPNKNKRISARQLERISKDESLPDEERSNANLELQRIKEAGKKRNKKSKRETVTVTDNVEHSGEE